MRRIKRLEKRLDSTLTEFDVRIKQLECEHFVEIVKDNTWAGIPCIDYYSKECGKCGKYFGSATKREYLEFSLGNSKIELDALNKQEKE